jgi:hypothetical protein
VISFFDQSNLWAVSPGGLVMGAFGTDLAAPDCWLNAEVVGSDVPITLRSRQCTFGDNGLCGDFYRLQSCLSAGFGFAPLTLC